MSTQNAAGSRNHRSRAVPVPCIRSAEAHEPDHLYSKNSSRLHFLRYLAAILSLFAALIHNVAMPEHFEEWWVYGSFFFIAATAQFFFSGLILLWLRNWIALAGIAGNLAIVILYIVVHTAGIPSIGSHPGHQDEVESLGLAATFAEVSLIYVLVVIARSRHYKTRG